MPGTSHYTIIIEIPQAQGAALLVHGYTAAYDRVSAEVAEYLRRHRRQARQAEPRPDAVPTSAWAPSDAELEHLTRRGYLTEKTFEEEQVLVEKLARHLSLAQQRQPPHYVIMPTYECNLRCHYCFQNDIRTAAHGRPSARVLDRPTVDRLFTAFEQIEARQPPRAEGVAPRSFLFFGGEPLQPATLPAISYFIEKARATGPATFAAVSNGVELHHFREHLGPDGIRSVQVTFDGPPEEHDRRRVGADGARSFERIARNVTLALSAGAQIKARINIDRHNLAGLPALAQEFIQRGWSRSPGFRAYAAALTGIADASRRISSWELQREVARMHARDAGTGFISAPDLALKRRLRGILREGESALQTLRPSSCIAHSTSYVFDAQGRIFACWERTGSDAEAVGRVDEHGRPLFFDTQRVWRERNAASNATCRACAYVFLCGGGCVSQARQAHGSYLDHYCDGFQQRFRAFALDVLGETDSGRVPGGEDFSAGCA